MEINLPYSFYLWHLDIPEERNFLEAEYIAFLIRLASKKLGVRYRKVLDLACGAGRHHRYLREEGFEVYGIDSNEELIGLAKERNKGYEDYYKVEDMRSIDYEEEFDVVLSWYTSFGFSDEENKLVLRNVYRALKPSGVFILDVPVKWREMMSITPHEEGLVEVVRLKSIDRYRFEYRAELYKEEERGLTRLAELGLTITVYPPDVLKRMLEEAGFNVLYAFANHGIINVTSFDLASLLERRVGRLVWVAYK